jgi:hypothetical protein
MSLTGTEFYRTIEEMPLLSWLYAKANLRMFDIYDQGIAAVFFFTNLFKKAHCGLLPVYLGWCLAGVIVLLFILLK